MFAQVPQGNRASEEQSTAGALVKEYPSRRGINPEARPGISNLIVVNGGTRKVPDSRRCSMPHPVCV
jgi:hypothetical protein